MEMRDSAQSVLVVGSVALDTVQTPFGTARDILGGSAVYFSLAASLFAPVRLVGVVGEDFPEEHLQFLRSRGIGLEGLTVAPGRTFRWDGLYEGRMDQARTRQVELNVLDGFRPVIPEAYRDSGFVFLANSSPQTQSHVRRQVLRPRFVLADTMDLWIETERAALLELLGQVDGLVLNDAEARRLSGRENLLGAARWICERGPRYCIIKKAEHGALMLGPRGAFVLPGYPTEQVRDPTGAGDSFAGALMGCAAERGGPLDETLRWALAYGTVVASFTIEDFGVRRLAGLGRKDVEGRLSGFLQATHLWLPPRR